MQDSAFKLCPLCREQIRQEAVKCRFCGEWLEPTEPESSLTSLARVECLRSNGSKVGCSDSPPMNIYVKRGFELLGPFSTGEARGLLGEGKLSLTDDACIAGSKENWKSLREVVPNVPPPVPPNFSLSETAAGSNGEMICDSADQSRAEAAKGRIVKRANYFIRHWRGQFSLGVSYWVNGFLASFVVAIAAVAVAAMQADVRTQAALTLVVFVLAISGSVWQWVGIWRSASNHFSRGGTHFWAGTAKVMVILGFLI